jgi:mono/diheme cytochrome c family protein
VRRFLSFTACAVLAACGPPPAAGDAARGEALHRSCTQCHGTEAYLPPARKVRSLAQLREETARWGDYYNPKLSAAEVEDLVAYLNRDFYRLPDGR